MGSLFSSEDINYKHGLDLYNKLQCSNNYSDVRISPCIGMVEVNIAASLAIDNRPIMKYLMSLPQFDPNALNGVVFMVAVKYNAIGYVSSWMHILDADLINYCLDNHIDSLTLEMILVLLPKSKYILQEYANIMLGLNIHTLCGLKYTVNDDVLDNIITTNNHILLRRIIHNLRQDQIDSAIVMSIQYYCVECYNILEKLYSEKSDNLITIAIKYNNSMVLDRLQDKQCDTVINI